MSRRWVSIELAGVWFYLGLILAEAVIDWTIERVESRHRIGPEPGGDPL